MHIGKLEELVAEAFTHPHYKFKSRDEVVPLAKRAWNRLSPEHKALVVRSWFKYLENEKRVVSADSVIPDSPAFNKELENLQVYRFVTQTNLYFLCHLLEKYAQVAYATHGDICLEFFVQKDPTFNSFEEFALQYSDLKKRLLLVPRGGFKSSIDIADCVQWVINYPEVTIAVITGVLPLAVDFVSEIKSHFTLIETGETGPDKKPVYGPKKLQDKNNRELSTSAFQVLFAEHCTKPGDSVQTEWQSPVPIIVGGEEKEPSIKAVGIEQAQAGWHHGILKIDDGVTDENSRNITRINTVKKTISLMKGMLHPFGFYDLIGTWYDNQDLYGDVIRAEEDAKEKDGLDTLVGSVDSGRFNSNSYCKVYLRACWWKTEEAEKAGKIDEELKEEDLVLWFPERLTYRYLKQEQKDDYFPLKYLNNPRKANYIKFPRELLIRRTIPHNQLPQQGIIVSTVDTAYSIQSFADYTVMITALIYGGRFYIINMVRGRYNEYDLPRVIANSANKWKPKRICIEDSIGVKWMGRELRREMDKLRISIPVEFVSLGQGSKKNSKKIKAKPVARLLGDERMFFLNSCEGLDEIYSELEKFTGSGDESHDDIVDALSLLADQFGAYADMEQKVNFASTQYISDRQSTERYNQVYGLGKYNKYNASQLIGDDNPVTAFEVQEASKGLPVQPEFDPLSDLV